MGVITSYSIHYTKLYDERWDVLAQVLPARADAAGLAEAEAASLRREAAEIMREHLKDEVSGRAATGRPARCRAMSSANRSADPYRRSGSLRIAISTMLSMSPRRRRMRRKADVERAAQMRASSPRSSLASFASAALGAVAGHRITSYNVCYTKLLRASCAACEATSTTSC